jgi:hypothetical protein
LKILVIVLAFFCWLNGTAQNYNKKGDKKLRYKKVEEARSFYYKAYMQNPDNYKTLKGLVLSNQYLEQTVEAEIWMQKIIEQGKETVEDVYLYSELLKTNDKFEESEEWFKKYAKLRPNDKKTKERKLYYEELKTLQLNSNYAISPVSVNTDDSDMGLFNFGKVVIFSSRGTKKLVSKKKSENWSDLDLYFAEKADPVRFENVEEFASKLNTPFNDGPVAFDPTTNKLFITRYAPNKANKIEGELFYHMQLVIAAWRNNEWNIEEEFFFNDKNYTVAHPSISFDGQLLFFASDIFGGYGGADLYLCIKNDGEWSAPFNLGPEVNTEGNEFFPFIAYDKTLYFSSNGHGGVGGYDIFSATHSGGVYKNVKNLGLDVNSGKDDVSVSFDPFQNKGYFASNRAGGKGLYDIYYFENKYMPIVISGVVRDYVTKQALPDINIELEHENGEIISSAKTDVEGKFIFTSFIQKAMVFRASSETYKMVENRLDMQSLKKDDEFVLNVFLNKK